MLRASRKINTLSGNSKSKEKKETIAVEKGGLSMKQARRKVIFDADVSYSDFFHGNLVFFLFICANPQHLFLMSTDS
jgi:hypothetical protein|uniref:Uncharacterized protein n=1 Tax=Populus trichocarpa TaxID=3694 RepID=A0A2K2ARC8_POPTR